MSVVHTDPQAAAVGATEAAFSGSALVSEIAKTATYTRACAESNGVLTLLSQQATLAIRAGVPLEMLRDTIQPFRRSRRSTSPR